MNKHKQNKNALLILPLLGLVMLFSGCEGFFGTKTDPSFIDVPIYTDRQVAYVPVQPVLDQFVSPVDVVPGYDELVYVVDEGSEEIVALDQSGVELGRKFIPGVRTIAQDRSLDIVAIGTVDTVLNGTNYTLDALYRLELKNQPYGIANATIERVTIHPFYFKTSFAASDADVRLQSISMRGDNRYYVARTGPNNSASRLGGPDDAVIFFDEEDDFITPVVMNTSGGFFPDYFKKPSTIAPIAQPPQSPFVSNEGDFIVGMSSDNVTLKVQFIDVTEGDAGTDYQIANLSVGDTSKADRFLYEPNRFANPSGVTFTGDGTNYIFVVDSEKDSLYQFTNTGLEGVPPPAGSAETKNILVSFGGSGTGLMEFNQPTGVAYLNKIVYVADKGNGRVLRFQLTTDFD